MATKPKDLNDLVNIDKYSERWHKPQDFEGIVLIYKQASLRTGTRGEYYVMTCLIEDTGEEVFISTGASQPMMIINALIAMGNPASRFQFAHEGDRWLMAKPDILEIR